MIGVRGKKILLGLHVLLVSTWTGALITVLWLQIAKHTFFLPEQYAIVDRTIFIIFDTIVMNISILVALSGLIFSMFTAWGFFRFRWIIFKWLGIVFLAILLMTLAGPAVNGMAAISDVFESDAATNPDYIGFGRGVIYYTILQLAVLCLIVFVSVLKPWGTREQKFRVNRKMVLIGGVIIGILLAAGILMQYMQILYYRNLSVEQINLSEMPDGSYTGEADYGFKYVVQVVVENNRLVGIEIKKNRDSFYAHLAEGIVQKMLREQRININAVTGATTTSKALIKTVETAVRVRKIR